MKQQTTDNTTLADEHEIHRLDALSSERQNLSAFHAIDQLDAIPSYVIRP